MTTFETLLIDLLPKTRRFAFGLLGVFFGSAECT
jgi:hypothetical protein